MGRIALWAIRKDADVPLVITGEKPNEGKRNRETNSDYGRGFRRTAGKRMGFPGLGTHRTAGRQNAEENLQGSDEWEP